MKIGTREFDTDNQCYVMGILNVTPDSFSDGGKWNTPDQAKRHTEEMLRGGADLIDIGGESTRPGHVPVSDQEEIDRVVPVIEMVKACFDVPVSVDTYKSAVAEAALKAGADLVNDIWGLKHDPKMAKLIADYEVPCCLMHNRDHTTYQNLMEEVCGDLRETLNLAAAAGIAGERIILDPGIGFGKTYQQNLSVMHHLERIRELGYPVLLGTSRKSMIGLTLDLPAQERVEGTLVTTVMGVEKGVSFVRVHDVKENARAIRMTQAILREGR